MLDWEEGKPYAVSALVGGLVGMVVAVVVECSLIEISLNPFYAVIFGVGFLSLGGLIIWRVMVSNDDLADGTRRLLLVFSTCVLLSGLCCFLLEKDWVAFLSPNQKVPLYLLLGVSLCFALTFSIADIINFMFSVYSAETAKTIIGTSAQIFLLLTGSVVMGAYSGLLFGLLDVEDDTSTHSRFRQDEELSWPVGLGVGMAVALGNQYLRSKTRGYNFDVLSAWEA